HHKSAIDERTNVARQLTLSRGRGPGGAGTAPRQLVEDLRGILERFDRLRNNAVVRGAGGPLEGSGQLPFWPVVGSPALLDAALSEALASPPYALALGDPPGKGGAVPEAAELSAERLGALAAEAGVDGLFLFRVRPSGLKAHVQVRLFDATTQSAYETE